MISVLKFNRVLKAVRRSGVHTELEALLHPTGHGGRPRQLRIDVFVASLIVCAAHYKDVALTNVHRVLTVDLDKTYREQLGVQFTAADGTAQTMRSAPSSASGTELTARSAEGNSMPGR